MSAFLGPIHSWLYGKIVFQNQLVNEIYQLAEEKGWDLFQIDKDKYGILPEGELADIVDENNIHGWLQDKVNLVENKLAYVVTALTDEKDERISAIIERANEYGKANSFESKSVAEAYTHLENLLLNGMPCDHVNRKIEEDENHIAWEQVVNIHARFWEQASGNVVYYDQIRESLIRGILEKSGLELEVENNMFSIVKNEK